MNTYMFPFMIDFVIVIIMIIIIVIKSKCFHECVGRANMWRNIPQMVATPSAD